MRVSVFKDSPYFDYDNFGCQVWLDGKRVTRVLEACEEAGWIVRDTERFDGANECFFREILRGRVSIVNPRLLPVPSVADPRDGAYCFFGHHPMCRCEHQ